MSKWHPFTHGQLRSKGDPMDGDTGIEDLWFVVPNNERLV